MKKVLLAFVSLLLVTISQLFAQDTLRFANSGFEDWETEPGYNVQASILSIPFFDEYVHPSVWNRAYYHMNKTITKKVIITVTATIDTDVPIHNYSKETKLIKEGSAAACLSSFQLNDVISESAITYGKDYLANYGLTEDMICASILSTGNLTRNGNGTYIKQIVDLGLLGCGGDKNEEELYETLKETDMNKYVEGGLALNGFYPTRLHGSYLYTTINDESTDAGEVILIGTKYNTETKKRMIVGAGYNNNLTATTSTYQDFDVYYKQLTAEEPDSLVIICMSSGLTNCADDSKLYLDDLFLLSDCPLVENAVVSGVTTNSAVVSWNNSRHLNWEYVYGEKGFDVTAEVPIIVEDTVVTLHNLLQNTDYEVYVRTVCSETNKSEWIKVEFTTETGEQLVCPLVTDVAVSQITTTGATITWTSTETAYEIAVGLEGFTIDESVLIQITESQYVLNDLQANTSYDIYVRAVQDGFQPGEWTKVSFSTEKVTCESVTELSISDITETTATITKPDSEGYSYEYVFVQNGSAIDYTNASVLDTETTLIENLLPNTTYSLAIRAKKEGCNASGWSVFEFTTKEVVVPQAPLMQSAIVAVLSPTSASIFITELDFVVEYCYGLKGFSVDDAEVSVLQTSYVLENLSHNSEYELYIRTTKEGYTPSEWTKYSFQTPDFPTCNAVETIAVDSITTKSCLISFEKETGFEYEVLIEGAIVVNQGDTAYFVSDLQPNATYVVQVQVAKDGYYASEWTTVSFTTDKETCESPNFTVGSITDSSAVVVLTQLEGYVYKLLYAKSGDEFDEEQAVVCTNANIELTSLLAETEYVVRIIAEKEGFHSSEWTEIQFTTKQKEIVVLPKAPAPSTFFAGVDNSNEENWLVYWVNYAGGEFDFSFEVMYGTKDFDATAAQIYLVDTNRIIIPNALDIYGQDIDMYVRTVGEGYESSEWVLYSFKLIYEVPVCRFCSPVTNLIVQDITETSAVISWDDSELNPENDWFEIAWREDFLCVNPSENIPTQTQKITESRYVLDQLKPNTTYMFYVRVGAEGYEPSEWAWKQFTTLEKTAIESVGAEQIVVYPTVSAGDVTISTDGSEEFSVAIYTVTGTMVESFEAVEKQISVQLDTKGRYLVVVTIGDRKIVRTVIIR